MVKEIDVPEEILHLLKTFACTRRNCPYLNTRKCLFHSRISIKRLIEAAERLWQGDVTLRVAERAAKLICSAYLLKPSEIYGKNPASLMAAALYISGVLEKEKVNQLQVAHVLGISEGTVGKRYKHLASILEIQIHPM